MKNAVILHGKNSREAYYSIEEAVSTNSHWLGWLQSELIIRDILAVNPQIPHNYNPEYGLWKKEFERFDITPETILVGHSCGGGFLVRWLSEHTDVHVGKVVLVAPWLDPEKTLDTGMFDFEIDSSLSARTGGITVFYSLDDESSVHQTVTQLREEIADIKYVEFEKHGHFCLGQMQTDKFPELLEEVLK